MHRAPFPGQGGRGSFIYVACSPSPTRLDPHKVRPHLGHFGRGRRAGVGPIHQRQHSFGGFKFQVQRSDDGVVFERLQPEWRSRGTCAAVC